MIELALFALGVMFLSIAWRLQVRVADLERRLAAAEPAQLEALDRALEERLVAVSDQKPEIALARVRRTLDPQEAEAVWPPGTRFRDGHGEAWKVAAWGLPVSERDGRRAGVPLGAFTGGPVTRLDWVLDDRRGIG